jgi:hypothetical protein
MSKLVRIGHRLGAKPGQRGGLLRLMLVGYQQAMRRGRGGRFLRRMYPDLGRKRNG